MRFLLCCLSLILLTGYARYKVPTQSFLSESSESNEFVYNLKQQALNHPLYMIIPRHRSQIRWYDFGHWLTWMLFGNDDDGIFGEGATYKPEDPPTLFKALSWTFRNPLHNFTFYTIGSAGRENSEFVLIKFNSKKLKFLRYKPKATITFAGDDTSFFLGFHGWKPFVSLRIVVSKSKCLDYYCGWRERGNFGIKLTLANN